MWTVKELLESGRFHSYFGDYQAAAGFLPFTYNQGRAAGVKAVDVITGGGLRYTVLQDRAMDIGRAEFFGIPLDFRSPVGVCHPAFYEPEGNRWLYTFGGGLLTTCGLTQVGAPSLDEGEELGQHGRISHVAAEDCWHRLQEGERPVLELGGTMREAKMLEYHLRLQRVLRSPVGENRISVQDRVTNLGPAPIPHMILYHVNVGHPLLDQGSVLEGTFQESRPRDETAAAEGGAWHLYQGPTDDYPDRAFYHRVQAGEDGLASASLTNEQLGLRLTVQFEAANLPWLVQWKHTRSGMYAAGLEPANCLVGGRNEERNAGRLRYLEPGSSLDYRVDIAVQWLGCP